MNHPAATGDSLSRTIGPLTIQMSGRENFVVAASAERIRPSDFEAGLLMICLCRLFIRVSHNPLIALHYGECQLT